MEYTVCKEAPLGKACWKAATDLTQRHCPVCRTRQCSSSSPLPEQGAQTSHGHRADEYKEDDEDDVGSIYLAVVVSVISFTFTVCALADVFRFYNTEKNKNK